MSKHSSTQVAGEVGPLALQMGTITGAVDDLVHGYEHLVHSLPNLTSQICNVHADTEQMAKQLEHRTRSLVDGYEYLQGLSTQLPDMFRETASAHRKTLQDAVSMMTPEEQKLIAEQEQVLLKVRSELQSISHERVIMDVLMRPAINETKRIHAHAQGESALVNQKRYARGITDSSARNAAAPARLVNAAPGTGRVQVADDRDTAIVMGNGRRHSASATTNVSFKNTAEQLSTPIHIPQYTPDLTAAVTARRDAARQQQSVHYTNTIEQSSTGAVGFGQRYAHNTRDTSTLPAMRTGSLPQEVANLVTSPLPAVSAAEMERNFRKSTRTVRRVRKETKYVEREPLAKSLADKLGHTEEEVQLLKKHLSHASQHFDKDQGKAIKRLQQLVEELQGQQSSKDKALLAAVETMLKESLAGNKKPENRDAEILKALESLLVPPKQVALVDRLHEYKVLTARPKQPVVPRTVPVIVPVPAPKVQEKPKCVEVQTETLPAPAAPVPAPVVQQVPQPPPPAPLPAAPVIVQVPAQTGVERELIELMQAVVTSQQQTMQGNQALILSLIHERNAQPEPVIRDDVSEMSEETPPPAPAPVPAPVVERAPTPPPPAPRAPSPPRYSTAFGSVVLGGELMVGPYATQPAVIPLDQKPCVLRGIPLPSSRKPRPADFSGAVPNQREGTSTGMFSTEMGAAEEKITEDVTTPPAKDVAGTDPHEHSAPVESDMLQVPAAGPAMLGLEGSGVSSTAGRGGSRQHTTPGAIDKVPAGSIPPHMRRIASAFTMRALAEAPQDPTVSTSATAPATATTSVAAAPGQGDLNTLLRNLQVLSGAPVPAPAAAQQVMTAELIAQKISEGVQLGVKQALGLMDTHHPHPGSQRTYYDATPRPNARHGGPDHRGLLSADNQQDEVRYSLQLLKSRRGGAGARKRGTHSSQESISATDSMSSEQFNANGVRSTYYSRLPHVTNNTNNIHHNEDVNRDVYQPPRRRELAVQEQRAQQAEVVKEMEFSRQQARKLLITDENSSFNDSVSLDEETAAHLRDPLLYNIRDDVSEMSSVDFGDHNNVRLMQRDEHQQRHLELFASQDAPKVRSDLPARTASSPARSKNNARHASKHCAHNDDLGLGIVPLVSRVLHQSATEEVLQDPRKFAAHRSDSNNNNDKHRREERDLSASAEEHMWDLDMTAPLVTVSTASRPGAAAVSCSSESDSTRSILSLSTKSSSDSSASRAIDGVESGAESGRDDVGGEIPRVDRALSMAEGRSGVAKRDSDRLRGSAASSSVDTSTTDSSEGRRPRHSLLPRYSPSASKGAPAPSRSSSRSRSRERTRAGAKARTSVSDSDGAGVNTDRLAAQLMLNVLELHKPSNYTVQPYLANPISSHVKGRSVGAVLKRSKMYATESVESAGSDESDDHHHSDLNCTGSSVSSHDDNLLEAVTSKSKGAGGLKLMGLGNSKLLTFR